MSSARQSCLSNSAGVPVVDLTGIDDQGWTVTVGAVAELTKESVDPKPRSKAAGHQPSLQLGKFGQTSCSFSGRDCEEVENQLSIDAISIQC